MPKAFDEKYVRKLELVQAIGNEVCEECGPHADCGEDPLGCSRVQNTIEMLDKFTLENQREQS